MNTKETVIMDKLEQTSNPLELKELGQSLTKGGYSLVYGLLEDLKRKLAASDEKGLDEVRDLLQKGRIALPSPGIISPSWEKIWDELEQMIFFKDEALRQVPVERREGEWQIVMDNPFTNEGISCYPGLSFVEAAYLYAYFRKDLKKNEYLRLQKIVSLITVEGAD